MVLFVLVVVAVLVWGHFALERNVNRMTRDLQDQLNEATASLHRVQEQVDELAHICEELRAAVRKPPIPAVGTIDDDF